MAYTPIRISMLRPVKIMPTISFMPFFFSFCALIRKYSATSVTKIATRHATSERPP